MQLAGYRHRLFPFIFDEISTAQEPERTNVRAFSGEQQDMSSSLRLVSVSQSGRAFGFNPALTFRKQGDSALNSSELGCLSPDFIYLI